MAKRQSRRIYRTQEETAATAAYYAEIRRLVEEEYKPAKADPTKVAVCRLRLFREAAGLSLTELAERTSLTRGTLARVETQKKASFRTLERYAAALGHGLKIEFPAARAKS